MDFSTCIIEGISAGSEEIKGCQINSLQAVDLIGLFGIKVKE